MSATAAAADDTKGETKQKRGKGKLLIVVGCVLLLAGAGGWFSGVIPGLLNRGHAEADAHGQAHAAAAGHDAPAAAPAHIFVDLPDVVTNLNNGSRRASFVKLRSKIEVAKPEDVAVVQANMPRVLDLVQGYLREIRPEELRGTAGTYRLREALIARIGVAAAPARIIDVLFVELLVQ